MTVSQWEVAGGMDTTRVPAGTGREAQRRHERDQAAVAYLVRTGNGDVVEILGLDGAAPVGLRCVNPACGKPFVATRVRQRACSGSCAQAARKVSAGGEAA